MDYTNVFVDDLYDVAMRNIMLVRDGTCPDTKTLHREYVSNVTFRNEVRNLVEDVLYIIRVCNRTKEQGDERHR